MSTVQAVSVTKTFNGDLSATAKVDAAALDSIVGSLASAHNSAKAALDVVLDNNNQLSAGSVGISQLDAGVRELLSEVSGSVFGSTAKLAVMSVGVANIVLSGEQTVNGKPLVSGDRVLLTAQTNPVENGLWIVSGGAWDRAVDLPAGGAVGNGWYLVVASGASSGTAYVSVSHGASVVGVDPLVFVGTGTLGVTSVGLASSDLQVTGSPITSSGSIGLTIAENVVTNGKVAKMAANTLKANLTGGTANPSDVSIPVFRAALGSGTPSNETFLRGDGVWSTPSQAYVNFATSISGGVLTLVGTLTAGRQLTIPNAAGTITTLEGNQTWTGANTFNGDTVMSAVTATSLRLTDASSLFATLLDVAPLTADRTIAVPNTSGTLSTLEGNQTWVGTQSFPDNNLQIVGSSDATKVVRFEVDGVTTATVRTITVPDANGSIPLRESPNTWTAPQSIVTAGGTTSIRSTDPNNATGFLALLNDRNSTAYDLEFAVPGSLFVGYGLVTADTAVVYSQRSIRIVSDNVSGEIVLGVGATGGTRMMTLLNGQAYFGATDPGGSEPWRFNGALRASGLNVSQANGAIELGLPGTTSTPFIDFHSGSAVADYHARIIASGGTTVGTGELTFLCSAINAPSRLRMSDATNINADINSTYLGHNSTDASAGNYLKTGYAGQAWMNSSSGVHTLRAAASGSAGAAISWTDTLAWSHVGLGFFGAAPTAKPTITGSRGGNAALADLLTKLASLGLLTDSSS